MDLTFEEGNGGSPAIDFHGRDRDGVCFVFKILPPEELAEAKHKGGGRGSSRPYSLFCKSRKLVEVSVDEDNGEVTVHKVWARTRCGRR